MVPPSWRGKTGFIRPRPSDALKYQWLSLLVLIMAVYIYIFYFKYIHASEKCRLRNVGHLVQASKRSSPLHNKADCCISGLTTLYGAVFTKSLNLWCTPVALLTDTKALYNEVCSPTRNRGTIRSRMVSLCCVTYKKNHMYSASYARHGIFWDDYAHFRTVDALVMTVICWLYPCGHLKGPR